VPSLAPVSTARNCITGCAVAGKFCCNSAFATADRKTVHLQTQVSARGPAARVARRPTQSGHRLTFVDFVELHTQMTGESDDFAGRGEADLPNAL